MITVDIIHTSPPLEQIGRRIDDAYEQTQRGRQQWIEGTLELACALAEARDRFPNNAAFSGWLAENGHDHIGDHDRAALINMASDSAIAVARIVLTETERWSWKYIWREEIEPRVVHVDNSAQMIPLVEDSQKETPLAPPQRTASPLSGDTLMEEIEPRLTSASKTAGILQLTENRPAQTAAPLSSDTRGDAAEALASPHHGKTAEIIELVKKPKKAALSAPRDNYIAAIEKFRAKTTAARARVDEFPRGVANYVAQLIGKMKEELEEMEKKLTARLERADAP